MEGESPEVAVARGDSGSSRKGSSRGKGKQGQLGLLCRHSCRQVDRYTLHVIALLMTHFPGPRRLVSGQGLSQAYMSRSRIFCPWHLVPRMGSIMHS